MIIFQCPECREKFEVEARYGGRRWRCICCQASVTIPDKNDEPIEAILDDDGPPIRADDPGLDGPRKGHPRTEAWDDEDRRIAEVWPGWAVTRVGVRVLGAGVSILLVAWIFLVAAKYIAESQPPQNFPRAQNMPVGILVGAGSVFGLAVLVFATLFITGQAICCQVPGPAAARGAAIASILGSIVSVVVLLILLLIAITATPAQRPADVTGTETLFRVLLWLAVGFAAIGSVLFVAFLAIVAGHFRRRALATLIVLYFVVLLLFIVYFVVVHIVRGSSAIALLSGNIGNAAGVGKAVEITFFVHQGVVLVGLLVMASVLGGSIRKSRLAQARSDN